MIAKKSLIPSIKFSKTSHQNYDLMQLFQITVQPQKKPLIYREFTVYFIQVKHTFLFFQKLFMEEKSQYYHREKYLKNFLEGNPYSYTLKIPRAKIG